MPYDAHANLASGLVTVAPVTPTGGLTLTVAPDSGVALPATPFSAVVAPVGLLPTHANAEIVRVTLVAGQVWTIVRAQEGTSARTVLVGDAVYVGGVTAKTLTDIESAVTAETARAAAALVPVALKTANYAANANEFVPVDATSGVVTVTLPTAPADKTRIGVKKIDASVNLVTLTCGGSDVFNKVAGSTSVSLTYQNQGVQFQYVAATAIWYAVASDIGLTALDTRYPKFAAVLLASLLAKEFADRRRQDRYFSQQVVTYDFYVDQTNGSDANSGASPDLAWKTLSKVNTAATAGSKIGLRRGCVWREVHTVPADFMLYGAYGPPLSPLPKIKVSKDYSAATWTLVSGSTWHATITAPGTPAGLAFWLEDTVLLPAGSAGAVTVGTFDITGTTFTIWLPDNSNPNGQQIEVTDLSGTGFQDKKNGTILQDIAFKHHASYAILKQPSAYTPGGRYSRLEIGPAMGPDGINWGLTVGGIIEDCYIHDVWGGVEYPSGQGKGINVSGICYDLEIRHNRVFHCYKGIATANVTHKDLRVHHNMVWKSRVNCYDIQGGVVGWQPHIYNNVAFHSPATVSAAGHGMTMQAAFCGPKWRNNIVICDYTGTPTNVQLYCLSGTLTGTDVDYNLGFKLPGCTAKWGQITGVYYDLLSDWQAALAGAGFAGNEAHGVNADPLFTDYANGDFTLQPGSPARNAGQIVTAPGDIYVGTTADMGVFETA